MNGAAPCQARPPRRPACLLSEHAWGLILSAPALLCLTLFALLPIIAALWLSLYRHQPVFGVREFVGLGNYAGLLADDRFWRALRTTVYFTGVSVSLELAVGLGLALLLDRNWRGLPEETPGAGWAWARVLVLLPWAIPTVVSARMWGWLYQPEAGLVNHVLLASGLVREPINWLGDPWWAIHAAILMDVWKTAPFAAILLLAGLKAIPTDLYLAAWVEGAGSWTRCRHITLPLLTPVLVIALTFRTMDAFRVFDAVYVLTGGGPGNGTETLSIYAYKTLFQSLQFGYGSALASTTFLAILAITAGYFLVLRRHVGPRVSSVVR